MPRYARPKIPSGTERAIGVFSNSTKVAIVGYLAKAGPATRGDVARGLEIGVPTAQNNLVQLEAEGVLIADPPASEERNGQRVRYSVDVDEVTRRYSILGRALGLNEDRPEDLGSLRKS
ncbi:winged helix-turn-helix domain-containing protein [Paenarthrobacter sp. YIM B13468]|uniref:helix-turn-helix domain-containing protein n=1 Tax=Paenarthrobacter sp. YIM B13468 TaxID=3366295 RepID=UPI00366FDAFA